MRRALFVLALASCSDAGEAPQPQPPLVKVVSETVPHPPVGLAAQAGSSLPWPKLQNPDAWEAQLVELQAGAGIPAVPTESGTAEQRQAIDRARALTERLSLSPKDTGLLLKLANTYSANLFPDRSLAVLGTCLSQTPGNSLALKMAAAGLAAQNRHRDALAIWEHLTELTPDDVGLAGPMYSSYWELGELEAGRAALEKGLELHPFQPHLKLRLGAVLFEFEEYESALTLFQDATGSRPNDTEAWYRLASCYAELGAVSEARAATQQHDRLIQMEEFGIPDRLHEGPRRLELVRALVKSGDLIGARRELDNLKDDGLPVAAPGLPGEFADVLP